jgi:DMSO/TMAO reductase YedYZ molybdopterin-dependent catalytic subunit
LTGALTGAASLLLPPGARRAARAEGGGGLLMLSDAPQNFATPLEYFDRPITPNSVFFVRSHFGPPALDPKRKLSVAGGKAPLELAPPDLRRFKEYTLTAVLECAGNSRSFHRPRVPGVQWTHGAMGQAEWTGVRLADLLEKAGLPPGAAWVHLAGADLPPGPRVPRFLRSIPVARALDPGTLVAYRMNGEPLSLAHGAPLRLVVPGWAGDHWVKWLTAIRVESAEAEGFYSATAYRLPKAPVAPGSAVKKEDLTPVTWLALRSVIGRPAEGEVVAPGARDVVGVAFSGDAAIARVEVSLDGGARFEEAALEGAAGAGRWVVFRRRFTAERGAAYRAVARAFDAAGREQPKDAAWNPSGYLWNGWHEVAFRGAS